MSTRSNIIVRRADSKYAVIYCHFDGYVEGVGATLLKHYSTQERAEALVAPGDISVLAEHCDKPEGHSFARPAEGRTIYYGRDRGETSVEPYITDDRDAAIERGTQEEYSYLWEDGQWRVWAFDDEDADAGKEDDALRYVPVSDLLPEED